MKTMKKLLAAVLATVMLLGVTACGTRTIHLPPTATTPVPRVPLS